MIAPRRRARRPHVSAGLPSIQSHEGPFADRVVNVLTPLLGPHTARRALAMICKRAGKEPAELGDADLGVAQNTLRPMLRTLIGNEVTIRVLAELAAQPERPGLSARSGSTLGRSAGERE